MNASRPAHMGRISSGKEGGFKSSIKAAVSVRSPSITAAPEHPCQKSDIKCGLPIRLIVVHLGGQSRQPIQHGGHLPDGVAEQMLQLLLVSNLRQKALSGFIVKDPLLGLAMKKTAVLLGVDAVKQAVM